MVNIGSTATGARVVAVKADMARLQLTTACTEINEKLRCLDVLKSIGV